MELGTMVVKFLIAMSGSMVLGLYLHYDYTAYGPDFWEHMLAPKQFSHVVFHTAMLFLPVVTVYPALLLHQREELLARIKASEEELRTLSLTDELTGLYNRRGLTLLMEQEIRRANRTMKGLSVVYLDLDNLKKINDQHGHHEGDRALVEIASTLKEVFRESDIIARIGGDEFVIIPTDDNDEGRVMISRLRAVIEERAVSNGHPHKLSVSMGTAYYDPSSPATVEELLAQADSAMYEMKRAKRGR
jgi:diguanylate cyclase (GGDEF)-like protein